MKVSNGICGNQGPNYAFGPAGQVYLSWIGTTGGARQRPRTADQRRSGSCAPSTSRADLQQRPARLVVTYNPFTSGAVLGRRWLATAVTLRSKMPDRPDLPPLRPGHAHLDDDNAHGDVDMAFQVELPSGQGQIQFTRSSDGDNTWSAPTRHRRSGRRSPVLPLDRRFRREDHRRVLRQPGDRRQLLPHPGTVQQCDRARLPPAWPCGTSTSDRRWQRPGDPASVVTERAHQPQPGAVRGPAGALLQGLHHGLGGRGQHDRAAAWTDQREHRRDRT